MRAPLTVLTLSILAACTNPPVPDSGAGVGFGDYGTYQAQRMQREVDLAGSIKTTAISSETIAAGTPQPTAAGTTQPTTVGQPISALTPIDTNNPGISDEQDFSAVASRETIESDQERIEANKEAYTVIQPTALPTREGSSGPSVVEFALSTQNAVGQPIYSRSSIMGASRFNKNCSKYTSSDQAQEAFLKAGGPKKDGKGLDPDGDGFACYWDPTPFRRAVTN